MKIVRLQHKKSTIHFANNEKNFLSDPVIGNK